MQLNVDKADAEAMSVDRDGTGNDQGRQGMDVWINGFKIHFEDEDDALELARLIRRRMGIPVD